MVNSDFAEQLKSRHETLLSEMQLQQEKLTQLEEMMRLEGLQIDSYSSSNPPPTLTANDVFSNLPIDSDSLNRAVRSAQRRNRNPKTLTDLQIFAKELLEQQNKLLPLADIENAILAAGYAIPGQGEKANLVQELVGKAPDVFVRLGHGEYGLAEWVRSAGAEIIRKQGGSTGLLILAPELQKLGLLPHGTYSRENLAEILAGMGPITVTEDERGVLTFSL